MDYSTTKMVSDIQTGKVGESIFVDDFLKFMHIQYRDVTGTQGFRVIDSDYLTKIGLYEIKTNYHDDKKIIIEEYTNINEELCQLSFGWFYKSKANVLVFISKQTRMMILIPFTEEFKKHYENIKESYNLIRNKVSIRNGRKWQSAFRIIPLDALSGYFAIYKRI